MNEIVRANSPNPTPSPFFSPKISDGYSRFSILTIFDDHSSDIIRRYMSEIVEESHVQERSSIAVAEHGFVVADEEEEKQIQGKDGGKRRTRIRKAKKMVMYPFKRINSLYSSNTNTSNNQCPPPSVSASSSYSVVSSSSSSSSKFSLGSSSKYPYYYGERPIARCYLCFMEPPVEDDSPPVVSGKKENNPNISSYEYVKNLIERNDFYSDDCNVHRN